MARHSWNGMAWRGLVRLAAASRAAAVPLLAALLVGLVLLPVATPRSALAQEDAQQKAAAEALFNEGQELLFHRQYEAACRRFEQSQAIDPGVGTLLYLGDCYQRLGRFASAWAIYREAYSAARAGGQPERSRVASERADALLPHLSKLSLVVAAEDRAAGLEVTINDKLLNPALWGVAFPIDAGRYQLVARAPGRVSWSSTIEVAPGGQQLTVQVPALAAASGAEAAPAVTPPGAPWAPPSAGAAAPPAMSAPPPDAAKDLGPRLGSRQRTGLIVAASGAGAIGLGAVFGLVAKSKDDEAAKECTAAGCPTRAAADLNEQARSWASVANGAYALGGLALVTGGVLYFWPQKSASSAARGSSLGLCADLGPQGGMLTFRGEL
jgi:hypothetical protein